MAVAFSGGLDSTVLAKAAWEALGEKALAITAHSASSCANEIEDARRIADEIGIAHKRLASREFEDENYVRNDKDRCYHCKKVRFSEIVHYAREHGFSLVVDGSNADDQLDYRPGKRAAEELDVRSPLAELGITKTQLRTLAEQWNLSNWNMPAQPCLSTRIAYGIPLEDSLLRKVEAGEILLRELGFSPVRLRIHENDLARIEVPPEQLSRIWETEIRRRVLTALSDLGIKHITVDLGGFQSGSMNRGIIVT